jgi:methionyl-tRNA formyltransferase
MGTPGFVVPIFDKIASRHKIEAVFTRAPKPVGRKKIITKTPVHAWAESKNIPVYTNINKLANPVPAFAGMTNRIPNPDYIVVAAYGVILKKEALDFAPCLNIHPSMLPKYRGAAPIVSAILNGDAETGVCLMKMAEEVDAGDVLLCERLPIGENETTADIEKKVSKAAGDMVLRYLDAPEGFPPVPQSGEPTFTRKITNDDLSVDWKKTPREIHNQIRAIGGRTIINGIEIKILETEIAGGELEIKTVQPAGKKPMGWADFMNGQHEKCDIR